MNDNCYVLVTILALFILSFISRALPFAFSRILKNSLSLQTIGDYLPPYVMLLLVIYEIGIMRFTHYPYAIPAIVALLILTLAHYWKRHMLLSMLIGAITYSAMVLLMHHA